MTMQENKKHHKNNMFWYCYSMDVFDYLHDEKKISYITKAKHHKTNMPFVLFFRDEVAQALSELKVSQN